MKSFGAFTIGATVAVVVFAAPFATSAPSASSAPAGPITSATVVGSSGEIVLSIVDTIAVGQELSGLVYVAKPSGDRVYVANRSAGQSSILVIDPRTNTVVDTIDATDNFPANADPTAITIGFDDTVYVAMSGPREIASIDTATNTVSQTAPIVSGGNPPAPTALAVAGRGTTDDTIYVSSDTASGGLPVPWILSVIDADPFAFDDTIALPGTPSFSPGVAVSSDDTVFMTDWFRGEVIIVNGRTQVVDDTVSVGVRPGAIVVTPDDTVYVANIISASISVIDAVQGQVVSTIALGINQSPQGMAYDHDSQRLYVPTSRGVLMAIDTVTNTIDDSLAGLSQNTRGITMSDDGSRIYVANHPDSVTVISTRPPTPSPDPAPASPAGPPLDVTANPGDQSAVVTWSAPSAGGSFPITTYQTTSEPGSRTCLVPATSTTCRITGLSNGQSYSLRVRALNGAGWGAWSESVTVIPQRPEPARSIVITGSRDGRFVVVTGATTGLVGERVTPWVRLPGPGGYQPESGGPRVAANGGFTWQRVTKKKISVYFRAGDVRSDRVVIRAR